MERLYLGLLEHAVEEFLAGFRAFERLRAMPASKRKAIDVVRMLIALHLGIDKAAKHALCRVDPALVIKSLNHDTLQRLHRERLSAAAPSVFAVGSRVETHHLIGLLNIVRDFVVPPLESAGYDEFVALVQGLTDIRNQVVHKEFFAEFDYVAGTVQQVLSRCRAVLAVLNPEFLDAASKRNDQLISRLKAVELEVDGDWQVLVDYLAAGREISLNLSVWVTIAPGAEVASVSVSGGTSVLSDSLTTQATVRRDADRGFLHKEVPLPPPTPLETLWGALDVPSRSVTAFPLLGLLKSPSSAPSPAPMERAIIPIESSRIQWSGTPASLTLSLKDLTQSYVGTTVQIGSLGIDFQGGVREGQIVGTLKPSKTAKVGTDGLVIQVVGTALLESEFAVRESSEYWPAGTTMRHIRCPVRLSLVAQG